jgi:DNA-binding response OmpR family regulator
MNTPPSDTEEGTIDIFVLTRSSDNASLLKEYLEQRGFCLTLFNDGPQLTESLRFGKPNLLISDTTSVGDEGFEVCRQIKADDDLWMIPVMIITGASALTDLLRVLDCNADNFIAYPYDAQYLLSLVDVMLVTPVERQDPAR